MNLFSTALDGALIIEPDVFSDHRGFFMETYHQKRYQEHGIQTVFVQDNLSKSTRGTLRGLHYQIRHPQAKLVQVIDGEIYDVAVDIRPGSPFFGKWLGVFLSGKNKRQLFIPEGFAHGFCVLSETAFFSYKCSAFYAPNDEGGILWSDAELGIDWPIQDPLISEKDSHFPLLSQIPKETLPLLKDVS
ncbi:MAG: dTDP-4-dehydrorhamnose 3,5-epimerase [Desulfobacterales bacterium CG07_land_8_20_14_0_80_52_14]|nr:MAG: dTDP-4-dehydrorhamnose 3,5-epimerase [Desulfobacterales bacterium CG07_land_8_20_14_0_80_52_14]